MRPTSRWAAIVTVLAVLAGACGEDPAEDDSASATTATSVEEPGTTDASAAEAPVEESGNGDGAGEEEPDSLADFLGFDFDDPDSTAAFSAEMERRVQETIASCMAQEGFEYIPAVRTQGGFGFSVQDEETFAREQGFGITTWVGQEDAFLSSDEDWVDPNAEIVASLSDSEREAYNEVLYGESPAFGDGGPRDGGPRDGPGVVDDFFGSGCTGQAFQEVYGSWAQVFTELAPQFEELQQRVQADPRFKEANEQWAGCMADRGFPYDSQEAMFDQVNEEFSRRLEEITGAGGFDPFAALSEEEIEEFMAERSDEEIADFFDLAQQEALAAIDQEALAALQQEEIDIAVASFECSSETDVSIEDIFRDYEGDFVRENRDVLEGLRS